MRKHHRFDYQKAKPNRFASRLSEEAIAVVLDPDVREYLPDSEAVNKTPRIHISLVPEKHRIPEGG